MEKKKAKYLQPMMQITTMVPARLAVDLARLAQADGVSMNTFSRKFLQMGVEAEKAKRGWL